MPECISCGKKLQHGSTFCEFCGAKQSSPTPTKFKKKEGNLLSKSRRFYALEIVQAIYRIFAWIILIAAPIAGYATANDVGGNTYMGAVIGMMLGVLVWLFLMTLAEGISVIINIQDNTKETTAAIRELTQQLTRDSQNQ